MRPLLVLLLLAVPAAAAGQNSFDAPQPPPEASQFDYLLGSWTFVAHTKNPNSPVPDYSGTWRATKAYDGFGIEDEWRIVNPDNGAAVYIGKSMRVYNPAEKRWDLRFLDVYRAAFSEQFAQWRDGEMHLWWSGRDRRGDYQVKVKYYDITPDRFRWKMDRSYDDGASWIEDYLTMEVVRSGGSGE